VNWKTLLPLGFPECTGAFALKRWDTPEMRRVLGRKKRKSREEKKSRINKRSKDWSKIRHLKLTTCMLVIVLRGEHQPDVYT